jgi:hypothetical protein
VFGRGSYAFLRVPQAAETDEAPDPCNGSLAAQIGRVFVAMAQPEVELIAQAGQIP